MDTIIKAGRLEKAAADDGELELVNRQTLRPLEREELFLFRLAACDNQVDRDYERFTDTALEDLAKLFVGKPVLMDHKWSAGSQTARVYAAEVEGEGTVKRLVLRCYMPRTEQAAGTITAIESGILRECSVGCTVDRVVCSICGANQAETLCRHSPGAEYEGALCVMELDGGKDAYEVSLVPVPAQPGAGVTKAKRYGGEGEPLEGGAPGVDARWREKAQLELEQERYRLGGN